MALDIGAAPTGNWSGCHAVQWEMQRAGVRRPRGRRPVPEALLSVRHADQRRGQALRRRGRGLPQLHLRQVRPRGAGAARASSPGRSSTPRCKHLLRDEYQHPQVTKVTANTLEELARKLEGVERRAVPAGRSQSTTPRCRRTCRSIPTSRTAARTERPGDQQDQLGEHASTRRPSRPMRSPAASPSPSAACTSTPTAQVLNTDCAADPGPLRRGRTGRRHVLFQLSRRHRPHLRRGVRQDRRHLGGARRQELSVISVNSLKPVMTRVTGARTYMHTPAVTLPTQPRPAEACPSGSGSSRRVSPLAGCSACAGWIWRELGSPDMVGYRD